MRICLLVCGVLSLSYFVKMGGNIINISRLESITANA